MGPFESGVINGVSREQNSSNKKAKQTKRPSLDISLDRYLPLGSITFPVDPKVDRLTDEWLELDLEGHFSSCYYESDISFQAILCLFEHSWVRLFGRRSAKDLSCATIRVYLLPDDVGRIVVPRDQRKARTALRQLMIVIDSSRDSWFCNGRPNECISRYEYRCGDEDSLFYIFNTLDSPDPDPRGVSCHYTADAMAEILKDSLRDSGLKTQLYPYQRRSAAVMLQREADPKSSLDPRLETFQGPTAIPLYYDRDAGTLLSGERTYHEIRGGILAETMGYGKTLICLAAVLATKNHLPQIPPEYSHQLDENYEDTLGTRPLATATAACMVRNNYPWKLAFAALESRGEHHGTSIGLLKNKFSSYTICEERFSRRHPNTVKRKISILATTLIVVPPNLLSQWRKEINTHLKEDAMSILAVDETTNSLPVTSALGEYDMILMTRTRFEEEVGRRGLRVTNGVQRCRCANARRLCPEHEYTSPLLNAHFFRFIVDEGQGFVSSSATSALAGLQDIIVDRKWIISGTPTSGMIGVEVDVAAEESTITPEESELDDHAEFRKLIVPVSSDEAKDFGLSGNKITAVMPKNLKRTLANRRKVSAIEQERKDIERLGNIVKYFLGVKPWANGISDRDTANWTSCVVPSRFGDRKPLSLRRVLQSLVVRHQIEDIEADLQLPPLYNKTVRLQPSFMDKLSINLFVLFLITNAVTSERTDQDYMFHPKNRKPLETLVRNMRSSSFSWTGMSEQEVSDTCRNGKNYLDEPSHEMSFEDRHCLETAIIAGLAALNSAAWVAFSATGDIGLYVESFPEDIAHWGLCKGTNRSPLLLSATHLEAVTKSVESHLYASDPVKQLKNIEAPTEISTASNSAALMNSSPKKNQAQAGSPITNGRGAPPSGILEVPKLTSGQFAMHSSASRNASLGSSKVKGAPRRQSSSSSQKSIMKDSSKTRPPIPQSYATVAKTKLVGTSSRKLSYLLDRIVELHQDEKILVFYEGDNIAYYCAQALEVLSIPHLIYASGTALKLRTDYQNKFNTEAEHRVMLMDLKLAAHGLHIASASRVFFVNPVWQPNIEAQAIKRAHRIGQTRPVYVETLVLESTFEDQMLGRRKSMTTQEHHNASKSMLDDTTMSDVIKNIKTISFSDGEAEEEAKQLAPLKTPQQVFARHIASAYSTSELEAFAETHEDPRSQGSVKKRAMFVDDLQTVESTTGPTQNEISASESEATHQAKKRKVTFYHGAEAGGSGSTASQSSVNTNGEVPALAASLSLRAPSTGGAVTVGDTIDVDASPTPRRAVKFAD